jgi:hypothetical protein
VCDTLRGAECRRLQKCAPNILSAIHGDLATCIARQKLQCTLGMMLRGVTISQAQTDACGTSFEANPCDSRVYPAACKLPGVVADGGPCLSDNQCKSAYCEGGTVATCGKCVPEPPDGTAAIGATCAASKDCEPWATCKDGKCAEAGRAKGQPCTDNYACIETKNLVCDDLAGCIEVTALSDVGGQCPQDTKNFTGTYCRDGICDPNVTPTLCRARSAEGGPCGTPETQCADPLACDAATRKCVVPPIDYEGVCQLSK